MNIRMKDINEYIKLPKDERQKHLKLDEPCLERGGQSMYLKGLLAHLHDTTIPSGKKIHVCHACHNAAYVATLITYIGGLLVRTRRMQTPMAENLFGIAWLKSMV